MVATDMSTCAVMAEKRAALLCRQLGIDTLDIINVQDLSVIDMLTRALKSPTDETKRVVREGLAADLENITKRLEEAYGINSRLVIRFGKPAHEITTRVIGEKKTGLLVVGAHGNDPSSDMFLGNLPSKLLQFNPVSIADCKKSPHDRIPENHRRSRFFRNIALSGTAGTGDSDTGDRNRTGSCLRSPQRRHDALCQRLGRAFA